MNIWVDADACPRVVKDILYRAAERKKVSLVLVANAPLQVPGSRFIRSVQVQQGFDVADNYIVQQAEKGDVVVTNDIPLAAEVVEKGCMALNPRGERYTRDNIRQRLQMRNFMEEMRSAGMETGGPAKMKAADQQEFANQIDRILQQFS